jgi:hypothetical protein
MVVGEFKSDNLKILFDKEERITTQYQQYCSYHNRVTVFEYAVTLKEKLEFILKFKLEQNGNNGEISNS